jgi:phage-related protein
VRHRKTALGVALVLGVVGWRALRDARPSRARPPLVTLVVLALVGQFDWDPLSWFTEIGSWISRVGNDVANFVYTVVGDAVKSIYAALNAGVDALDDALDGVNNALGFVSDWIAGEADRAATYFWQLIAGWWDAVEPLVRGWVDDLRNDATSAISNVVNWATDLINDVRNTAAALYDNVILPLVNWVEQAADWFAHMVAAWWSVIYDNLIRPEFDLLTKGLQTLADIATWFYNELPTMWKILTGALDWLAWFAVHTFEDIGELVTGTLGGVNQSWLQSVIKPNDEVLGVVDDWLERVLS